MGSIEAIIGILLICVVAFIYDLDNYYSISLPPVSVLAVVLIVAGIVQIYFCICEESERINFNFAEYTKSESGFCHRKAHA